MKRKNLLSLILTVLFVAFIFSPLQFGLQSNEIVAKAACELSTEQIVNYFNSRVGESYTSNACLAFIADGFQALGAERSSACCAYNYGLSHLSSTSRDIPIGADVFFTSEGCKYDFIDGNGHHSGHIGVYVGDGYIVHSYSSKIQKMLISTVESHGYTYWGWGYHGGIYIVPTTSNISITNESYPTGNRPVGLNFWVKGVISSNYPLSRVWGGVYNADGTPTPQYCDNETDLRSYDLDTYFDDYIIFDDLPEGYFIYRIEATDNQGYSKVLIESEFSVGNPPPPREKGHIMTEAEASGQVLPDGDYGILGTLSVPCFVDPAPGSDVPAVSGSNVSIWGYDEPLAAHDVWTLTYLNNGFYRITQKDTDMCLDVCDSSIYAETNVRLYPWNESDAQQWSIQKNGEGYKLQSRCNSFYLDIAGGSTENGTNIWVYQGNESAAQTFTFIPYTPFGDEGLTITVNPIEVTMDELISNKYVVPLSVNAKLSPNFITDENIWKNKLKYGLSFDSVEFGLSFDERLNVSWKNFIWYVFTSWKYEQPELEMNLDFGSINLPEDVKPGDIFHIKYADKGLGSTARHMYYFRFDSEYYDLAESGLVAWNDGYIKIKDELWLDETTVTMHFGEKYNIKANQTGLVYKTGNPDVAIVSKDGVVTAVGNGKTTILVYNSESEVKQLEVTVQDKIVDGDVNKDGNLDVTDVVMLQKWILSIKGSKLTNAKAADLNGDGVVDVFDLGLLKHKLLSKK